MVFEQDITHVNRSSIQVSGIHSGKNNLNTCTSAKQEARANAAPPINDISVAEFGVPEAGVTSAGGTKDSVSFGGQNEMLPSTQSINRL